MCKRYRLYGAAGSDAASDANAGSTNVYSCACSATGAAETQRLREAGSSGQRVGGCAQIASCGWERRKAIDGGGGSWVSPTRFSKW